MGKTDDDKVQGSITPIIPIDFTPNDGKGPRVTYKFKWIHLAVAVFGIISAAAGWFVLTAKSVFVEIDPITAQIEIEGGFKVRLGQRYLIRSGSYELTLRNDGYHDSVTQLLVSAEQSQTHGSVSYTHLTLPTKA